MLIKSAPDSMQKLALQANDAGFEAAGDDPRREQSADAKVLPCVSSVTTPQGQMPVLKVGLTTACERDCYYCAFRKGRDSRRVTFKPDELAGAFDRMQRKGLVQGLFLSSGIAGGGPRTQDRLLDTVSILRKKYEYRGFVHLKIMPGTEKEQVAESVKLADRVSVNLEAANERHLPTLAPMKDFGGELLERLRWAREVQAGGRIRASMVTQFVVGAAGETDVELLSTTQMLYRNLALARTYFMAFSPIVNTPFDNLPPAPLLRQNRLYQASFLLRDYGFDMEELSFMQDGHLPLDVDPKLAYARLSLAENPLDLMSAERHDLLRVPGIGPKSADALLAARRMGHLRDLSDLRRAGLRGVERAAPFILLDGKRPARQLSLW